MTKFNNFDLATAQSLVKHTSNEGTKNLLLYNTMFAYSEMKEAEETYNAKVEELKHCNWRDYGRLLTERNEAKKVFDAKKEIVDAVVEGAGLDADYFDAGNTRRKDGHIIDFEYETDVVSYDIPSEFGSALEASMKSIKHVDDIVGVVKRASVTDIKSLGGRPISSNAITNIYYNIFKRNRDVLPTEIFGFNSEETFCKTSIRNVFSCHIVSTSTFFREYNIVTKTTMEQNGMYSFSYLA